MTGLIMLTTYIMYNLSKEIRRSIQIYFYFIQNGINICLNKCANTMRNEIST